MKVTVEYTAQLKRAAGVGTETFELDAPVTLRRLVEAAVLCHGDDFQRILLDEDGTLNGSILPFIGENQISRDPETELQDGDVLTIVTPISGG